MSLQWLEGSTQCPSPISTCSVEGDQASPLINTAIRSFQPPKLVHGEITAGALKCCPVSQAGLTGGCWGGGKRSASAGAGSCTVHWLEPPVEWFELDPMCILDTLPKTALHLLICPFHGWTLPESRVQQAQCCKLYVHVSRDEGWLKQPHTITCYKNCYCPECWKRSISLSPTFILHHPIPRIGCCSCKHTMRTDYASKRTASVSFIRRHAAAGLRNCTQAAGVALPLNSHKAPADSLWGSQSSYQPRGTQIHHDQSSLSLISNAEKVYDKYL